MVNYQNGKIYKIWDVAFTKCYIGSTCEDIKKRYTRHKENYHRYKNGKYHYVSVYDLFDEFGIENCKIVWEEDFSCGSKKELEKREGLIQKENDCINKRVAGRSDKEWRIDHKEHVKLVAKSYRENNPEKCKANAQNWYNNNKEYSNAKSRANYANNKEEYNKQGKIRYEKKKLIRYTCACGSDVACIRKKVHERTLKHQQYLQSQTTPQE